MKASLEQISQAQLAMFTFTYLFTTNIGFLISPLIGAGSYTAWLSLLAANIIALFFVYIAFYVCEQCPKKSFLDHGDAIVTRWIHLFFLGYIGFYFFHYASLISRFFQDFIIQTYLPTTPDWAISFLICVLAIIAVWSGIETIFRFTQLFFFLTVAAATSIPLLILTNLEFDMLVAFINRFPVVQVFGTTMYTVPWYTDILIVVLFYHLISESKKSFKSISIFMVLTTFVLIPNLLVTIMVFRPDYGSDLTYPILEVIRQVSIANFIENVDPILVAIWMTGICIKFSICLYSATKVLAKLLNIYNYRMLVPPMGLFLYAYSMHMGGTSAEINHFITQAWAGYGWSIIGILMFYFLVLKIRKLGKKDALASKNKTENL
ncbi:MAG: spore germination protein [Bacillus sp. (in: Bacteria)]|nr:spore germination protein [Bacillus sp. (in: firmicutes)]